MGVAPFMMAAFLGLNELCYEYEIDMNDILWPLQ